MKRLKIDLDNIKKENIDLIVKAFLAGQVIVYPTDTVYGLGCIATSKKAIGKIKKIKNRDNKKPFLFLVKSFCMTKKYAKVSKKQDIFLRTVWPSRTSSKKVIKEAELSPKTIVFQSSGLLPNEIETSDKSIALRLPKNDFLSTILKKIDLPLVSTSLNMSGEKPINDLGNVEKYFKTLKPDLIIDAGILKKKKPSQLIDIRDIENIKKIR